MVEGQDARKDPGPLGSSLWIALLALQSEAIQIQRDAEGQVANRKYKYASLTSVNAAVLARLSDYGLLWTTKPVIDDGIPSLAYMMRHVGSGETLEGIMPLGVGTSPTPQEQGSGLTYARRYSLMAVLNLVPAETDDDGAKVPKSASERKISEKVRLTILETLAARFGDPKQISLWLGSIGVSSDALTWTQSDQLKIRNGLRKRRET